MKSMVLDKNWSVCVGDDKYICDLPHDATRGAVKDYSAAFGECNGYVPAARAVFTKALPQIKNDKATLWISGACGCGDVFVNDEKIGSVSGYAPAVLPLGGALEGAHNTLRIELFQAPGMTDKYVGLGIAGGVKLLVSDKNSGFGAPMFVKTVAVGDRTYADVRLYIYNNGDAPLKAVAECVVLNARGKRAGKKQKKVFVRARQTKVMDVRVRINNPYRWMPTDPYMYSAAARLIRSDGSEDTDRTRFGIVNRTLGSLRGLYINGKRTQLFGAYLSHADAALGGASVYANEKRRLLALKQLGYNAVHFVECPTEAALDACDDCGVYAYVDMYSQLFSSKAPFCGAPVYLDPEASVLMLRNHPSVMLYGIADDVPECYGRNGGHSVIAYIAESIRTVDDTRPTVVSSRELVPTFKEFEAAGYKKLHYDSDASAISAGREKNIYEKLTAGAFDAVDVCGLNYLYPLYDSESYKRDERLVLGSRTDNARAFDSIEATLKNDRVIGDFSDCGIDYPGGGKAGEALCTSGDIDAICCEKPSAYYKRILLGARDVAYIVAVDPDTGKEVHAWNWTRYLGQKITVRVYTSGDVVALYFNGRIVGRKLAGKINRHVSAFEVDYSSGRLEAVAYFRGIECARATLCSAGSPKSVKLSAFEKNLSVSRGDLGFVTVDVCDKEGELVTYARRELNVTVTGGELVAFINADPALKKYEPDSCPAYEGRALAVIKPDEGETKAVVKVAGDGLLASKISFKIKN